MRLLAVVGLVFALLPLGVLLLLANAQGESAHFNESELTRPDFGGTPVAENSSPPHETVLDIGVENSVTDPRTVCKDPLGELSDVCLRSLDTYFWNKSFVWGSFEWIPVPMTYGRIFSDPQGDRDRVFAALKRPECRLEEGEIRWDLNESCHAESFANYANFIYFCMDVAHSVTIFEDDSLTPPDIESMNVRKSVFQKYEDWDHEYKRTSQWAGERFLEGRWVVERSCVRHDVQALELLFVEDKGGIERLKTIGQKLGLVSETWESSSLEAFFHQVSGSSEKSFGPRDAFKVLLALAARLGDEWAAGAFESTIEDEAWNTQEAKLMPWKDYLQIMRASIYWTRRNFDGEDAQSVDVASEYFRYFREIEALGRSFLNTGSDIRQSALVLALGAWEELDKADLEIDIDRLIEYVCGPNWSGSTQNCQDVIAELNETATTIDQQFWHRLEQINTRSIELGLFDNEPIFLNPNWEKNELGVNE